MIMRAPWALLSGGWGREGPSPVPGRKAARPEQLARQQRTPYNTNI